MKKEILKFAILLMVALGAGPVGAAFYQWSTTAATNAGADPSINWAEGQSPSSINDSARAMMAALAIWGKDTSASLPSGGTTSALTLTTNTGFPNLTALNFQKISFVYSIGSPNDAGATLNIDGTGAVPLETSAGVPVPASTLNVGGVYTVTYYSSANKYRLWDVYNNAYNVPLGALIPYTLATVPNGNFVFPAGQCLSTTTYATYWVAKGSPASGACAGGQFQIIDLSGRAPVGLDTMPGFAAANRLTSAATGCGTAMTSVGSSCANGVEGATVKLAELPAITSSGSNTISVLSALLLVDATGGLLDFNPPGAAGFRTVNNTASLRQQTSTGVNSISVTSSGTTNTVRPQVPPVVGVTYLLRVL